MLSIVVRPERASINSPNSAHVWRGLFISPSNPLGLEIVPLLARRPEMAPALQIRHYPTRQQLQETIAAHQINICFLDVSSNAHDALRCLTELLRLDNTMPVI